MQISSMPSRCCGLYGRCAKESATSDTLPTWNIENIVIICFGMMLLL